MEFALGYSMKLQIHKVDLVNCKLRLRYIQLSTRNGARYMIEIDYQKSFQIDTKYVPQFFGDKMLLFDRKQRYGKITLNKAEAAIICAINEEHNFTRVWECITSMYNIPADSLSARSAFEEYIHKLLDSEIIIPGNKTATIYGKPGKCYPFSVEIELTNCCNFRCTHCYKEAEASNTTYISTELIRNILHQLEGNTYYFDITGGEATLHPDFNEIVAMTNTPVLALVTNGSNLVNVPDETLLRFKCVQVSMYGCTDDEYRKYACANRFNAVCEGLRKLVRLGIDTTVAIILRPDNINRVNSYLELLENLGIKDVRFGASTKVGRNGHAESDWDLTFDECMEFTKQVKRLRTLHPSMHIAKIDFEGDFTEPLSPKGQYRIACDGGTNSIAISERGCIRPCVMMPAEYFGLTTWDEYLEAIEKGNLINFDSCVDRYCKELANEGKTIDQMCPQAFAERN